MAEIILKDKLKEASLKKIKVNSAGISAAIHHTLIKDLKAVTDEKGLHYTGNNPKMLNEKKMEKADIILVMTRVHKEEVNRRFPQYENKVFMLSEYVGDQHKRDVHDPIGLGKEAYGEVFKQIEDYIDKLIERLKNESGE
jgi:protein-tyrosine phosphatase